MKKMRILSALKRIEGFISGKNGVEWTFVAIFIAAGAAFALLVPPFQNPDEHMHYFRSYQLANGQIFSKSNGAQYGGDIPVTVHKMVYKSEIQHNFDYGYRFHLNYNELFQYKYGGEKQFEAFPNSAIYSPLAYIPSIFAHWIVSIINGPAIITIYLARISSLLIVATAMFFAIRIIPFGKWVLFAVGLLPMAVASSVSMSADAMTVATSVLLIATTLRIAFGKEKVSYKWLLPLFILVITMSLVKQAHVALLPIIFTIPIFNKNYRTRNIYLLFASIFAIAIMFFVGWYLKTDQITINFDPSIQPIAQKAYILHEPLRFIKVLFVTFFTNYANGFVIGLFGNFGWLTAQMPILFIIFSTLVLYWSTKTIGRSEYKYLPTGKTATLRFNVAMATIFLVVTTMISVALYIYWTPVKNSFIMGIQGRYFIPILPLLLLPFVRRTAENQQTLIRLVTIGTIIILLFGILTMTGRFYGIP